MRATFTVLTLCSVLLLFCSLMTGGNATWGLLRLSHYFWTTHLGAEMTAGALVVAGALLGVSACWLVMLAMQRPVTKMLPFYVTLMFLLSTSMFLTTGGMTSLFGLMRSVKSARFNESMSLALTSTPMDPMVYASFSVMQAELKCCGVHSYKDWYAVRSFLPQSCCGNSQFRVMSNMTKCTYPLYVNGCQYPAQVQLTRFFSTLTVYSASSILVMSVTLFVLAYMFVTEKSDRLGKTLSSMQIACLSSTLSSAAPPPAPQPRLAAYPGNTSMPAHQV